MDKYKNDVLLLFVYFEKDNFYIRGADLNSFSYVSLNLDFRLLRFSALRNNFRIFLICFTTA